MTFRHCLTTAMAFDFVRSEKEHNLHENANAFPWFRAWLQESISPGGMVKYHSALVNNCPDDRLVAAAAYFCVLA